MDYLHKPNRLLITGRSGTGKTEYFIRYVRAVSPRYKRVCVFDHECEFCARTGVEPCRTADDLGKNLPVECFDYAALYPGDKTTALEFHADWVFSRNEAAEDNPPQTLWCCDEMQKILGTDLIPPDVACVIETGRRYRIDTVLVTQQPNLLHNRFRNQATEVVTFRQNDSRAIQWLEEWGFSEEQIRGLDPGEYLCLTDQGQFRTGNIFSGKTAPARPVPLTVQSDQEENGQETNPENSVDRESSLEHSGKR